ncbi:MAG: Uma2 family endonuclease [Thermoanaerobaculia bacterium]
MSGIATRKFTYEDLRAMPLDGKRYELLEGEIYMAPSPNVKHQNVLLNLASALRAFVRERGLGAVFVAPLDVVLSDQNVVQPDIFFVRRDGFQAITPLFVNGAPDLAVEILSPSNADFDRTTKRRAYNAAGVPEVWYVDPRDDSIEVLRLGPDGAYALVSRLSGTDVLRSPSFPGFELPLSAIFS